MLNTSLIGTICGLMRRGWLWRRWSGVRRTAGEVLVVGWVLLAGAPGAAFGQEATAGQRFKDCPECPEMVVIPAGQFLMGCMGDLDCESNEKPLHVVRIARPFALSVYEVTFEEWFACALTLGCGGAIPDDEGWGVRDRPVINVPWAGAQRYVSWLSERTGKTYRLPSEAEWEYAARAQTGPGKKYHFGNNEGLLCQYANLADASYGSAQGHDVGNRCSDGYVNTAPVGSFKPNGFGLYDMHGNVWEWTADCYHSSYDGAPLDGSPRLGDDDCERVLRGGSWNGEPRVLRAANRGWNSTGYRDNINGFRVARTLTP